MPRWGWFGTDGEETEPEVTRETMFSACEREIRGLHDFFVDWYTGEREDFSRMVRVIDAAFERVDPEDREFDRAETLARVRDDHARQPPGTFRIDIQNVDLVEQLSHPDVAIVRYEEWQYDETADGTAGSGRVSTASFRLKPDTPEGVAWTAVHETWLRR